MSILPNVAIPSNLSDQVQMVATKQGKNPVFDFKAGEFVRTPTGRVSIAEGLDALKLWVMKAIITPRGLCDSYTEDFGNEVYYMIGASLPDSILFSEIERLCKEALIYDPRIQDVGGFVFVRQGDQVFLTFSVTTAEGVVDLKAALSV